MQIIIEEARKYSKHITSVNQLTVKYTSNFTEIPNNYFSTHCELEMEYVNNSGVKARIKEFTMLFEVI